MKPISPSATLGLLAVGIALGGMFAYTLLHADTFNFSDPVTGWEDHTSTPLYPPHEPGTPEWYFWKWGFGDEQATAKKPAWAQRDTADVVGGWVFSSDNGATYNQLRETYGHLSATLSTKPPTHGETRCFTFNALTNTWEPATPQPTLSIGHHGGKRR